MAAKMGKAPRQSIQNNPPSRRATDHDSGGGSPRPTTKAVKSPKQKA